ncbi:MAG: aldo/keto reductase [bacterium]|nr:MAG: aldo/keto reductase [bacterium]
MKYVEFGKTKEYLSEMCLGTMMFGDRCSEAEADRIIARAIDAGINFIDTAAMYCDGFTEEILGPILNGRREKVFLVTKVHKGVDKKSIIESIDESLIRLKMDYVDLYLIHWPKKGMNPTEIMEALNQVVEKGKTRFVGCCNYPAWLVTHHNAIAERNNWSTLICNQIPYNLIERGVEVEVLPHAYAENIAITSYRALVLGLLSGKYRPGEPIPANSRGVTDERIGNWLSQYGDGINKFLKLADELGITPAALAISWVRYSSAVTSPIVGVSSMNQFESCLKAFEFDLTEEQYNRLTKFFDTEVKEETGGAYKDLRRELRLLEDD